MLHYQDLFIMGSTGNVGKPCVRQVFEDGDMDPRYHDTPSRIVAVASSETVLYDPRGISKRDAIAFTLKRKRGVPFKSLLDFLEMAKRAAPDRSSLSFVDLTPLDQPMIEFDLELIRNTNYGIVMANKNPLIGPQAIFDELTANADRCGYRCSVMAGALVVNEMRDLRNIRDRPTKMETCISGTMNTVCSLLPVMRFSGAVAYAKGKGYTETHPGEDLSGRDAGKKVLILPRSAGYKVDFEDVHIVPLIPRRYLNQKNVELFMESLKELDPEFTERTRSLAAKGMVLRFVSGFEFKNGVFRAYSKPKAVPIRSPLGSLDGPMNSIVMETRYSREGSEVYPTSVNAPGAGPERTAANVRKDISHQVGIDHSRPRHVMLARR